VTSLGVKLLLLQHIFVDFHFSIFFFISGYHSCCYEEFHLWYIMPRSPGKDSVRFGRTIFTVEESAKQERVMKQAAIIISMQCALLTAFLILVSCLAYFSTVKVDEIGFPETSDGFHQPARCRIAEATTPP
jgi:hypothetical protein